MSHLPAFSQRPLSALTFLRRPTRLTGYLALTVGAALLWGCYGLWADARTSARQAQEDLERCQNLATEIQRLSEAPRLAQAQALEQLDLARRIEDAGRAAGLATGSIERIAPEQPRRLGETAYLEHATQISLRQVTLRQAATFLYQLSSANGGQLRIQALRLAAPRGLEASDLWRLEATLSYLVYAPKGGSPAASGASVSFAPGGLP